jgi:hypothetical protein
VAHNDDCDAARPDEARNPEEYTFTDKVSEFFGQLALLGGGVLLVALYFLLLMVVLAVIFIPVAWIIVQLSD